MNLKSALIARYHDLRRYGINDSHSGNASVRDGERFWITPTGACADTLTAGELIACPLDGTVPPGASQDARLHRAVYRQRPQAQAVLHSHGPYTVGLTLDGRDYVPVDFEGGLYFPVVPVVSIDYDAYFERAPAAVAAALATHPIMVIRGHGVYAVGDTLELAYKWTCSLEQSAKTAFIARLAGTLPDHGA